ncbi:MAG: exopolysaccharide biosynthesis polyprenyl glycosylphosphotransferase [Pseudomonadota bacterium]
MADRHLLATSGAELTALQRAPVRATPAAAKIPIALFANGLRLVDAAIVYLAGLAIYANYLGQEPAPAWAEYQLAMVVATVAALNLFSIAGIYDPRQLTAGRTGLVRLLCCWGAIWLGMMTTAALFKSAQDYSRVWFVGWGLGVCAGLWLSRIGSWLLVQHWIQTGRLTINLALIGDRRVIGDLMHVIGKTETRLHQIVGIFNDDAPAGDSAGGPGLGDLEALIRSGQVQEIVIAVPWTEEARILRLLDCLHAYPVDIRLAPEKFDFPFARARYSTMSGVTLLDVFSAPISGWKRVVKRLEDLLLGAALLALFLPLMVIIGLAVRWDSPGPIFFRQKRYGYNNTLIEVFKFRTMRVELTDHLAERLVGPNDPRVTRLGAWLRRTSLDELPQLLNVVRGDMSLVGPRPHALRAKAADRLYEDVVEQYASRHRVKPASPAGPRSRAGAASPTPRTRSAGASSMICITSSTGRCCSISRSWS